LPILQHFVVSWKAGDPHLAGLDSEEIGGLPGMFRGGCKTPVRLGEMPWNQEGPNSTLPPLAVKESEEVMASVVDCPLDSLDAHSMAEENLLGTAR
jgi:hypothetical protein